MATYVVIKTEDDSIESLVKLLEKNGITASTLIPSTTESWEDKLKGVLKSLSVNTTFKGYRFLNYAMEAIANNPKHRDKLKMRDVYQYVMKKTGESYHNVERDIRQLIHSIYKRNSTKYVNEVLNIPEGAEVKVTNSHFLGMMADFIFD